MLRALRRIPLPLLVAQVAATLLPLVIVLVVLAGATIQRGDSAHETLLTGSRHAIGVLSAVGLAWLARRLAGTPRAGVRVAMIAIIAGLVIQLGWIACVLYIVNTRESLPMALWKAETASASATAVVAAIGIAIATRRWWWIAIGACVAFLSTPPWFVIEWLQESASDTAVIVVWAASFAHGAIWLVMCTLACRDAAPLEEPAPLARGLCRARLALFALAFATAALAVITLVIGNTYDRVFHAHFTLMAMLATGLQVASLVVLALGALSAIRGRGELPAWLVVASSAVALAVAANLLQRVIMLSQRWAAEARIGPPGIGLSLAGSYGGLVAPVSTLLLMALAIGALLVAIAIAARRRGLEEVRARVVVLIGAFAVLALAATTAQRLIASAEELSALASLILIASNAALVTAWLLAARTLHRATHELAGAQSIPTAKVVQ